MLVLLVQGIDQKRHAVICTGINKRGATILYDQVAGILQRPRIFRVDGGNTVIELGRLGAMAWQVYSGLVVSSPSRLAKYLARIATSLSSINAACAPITGSLRSPSRYACNECLR